jgi:hypothetical protein
MISVLHRIDTLYFITIDISHFILGKPQNRMQASEEARFSRSLSMLIDPTLKNIYVFVCVHAYWSSWLKARKPFGMPCKALM